MLSSPTKGRTNVREAMSAKINASCALRLRPRKSLTDVKITRKPAPRPSVRSATRCQYRSYSVLGCDLRRRVEGRFSHVSSWPFNQRRQHPRVAEPVRRLLSATGDTSTPDRRTVAMSIFLTAPHWPFYLGCCYLK